jgi:D-arabinose 1-dehydrogenase-like Zn-dependent alcohol dehydrogenase
VRTVELTRPSRPLENVDVQERQPGPGDDLVRIQASGICNSDTHYRGGFPKTRVLPITLGHEIAGVIESVGNGVDPYRVGEKVAVHYVASDGTCVRCRDFGEQFCERCELFGLTRYGGFAQWISVPSHYAIAVPTQIPIEQAAVMMCSSATSLHALRKARHLPGESVAIFGVGGLGISAVQIAFAVGASTVYAVDIERSRLDLAEGLGATSMQVGSGTSDAIQRIGGADVALVLVDKPEVYPAAMAALRPRGRLVAVGIANGVVPAAPFSDLILGKHELIGSNDHLLHDIRALFHLAETGAIRLGHIVTDRIPPDAAPVNAALARLDNFGAGVRTVIVP